VSTAVDLPKPSDGVTTSKPSVPVGVSKPSIIRLRGVQIDLKESKTVRKTRAVKSDAATVSDTLGVTPTIAVASNETASVTATATGKGEVASTGKEELTAASASLEVPTSPTLDEVKSSMTTINEASPMVIEQEVMKNCNEPDVPTDMMGGKEMPQTMVTDLDDSPTDDQEPERVVTCQEIGDDKFKNENKETKVIEINEAENINKRTTVPCNITDDDAKRMGTDTVIEHETPAVTVLDTVIDHETPAVTVLDTVIDHETPAVTVIGSDSLHSVNEQDTLDTVIDHETPAVTVIGSDSLHSVKVQDTLETVINYETPAFTVIGSDSLHSVKRQDTLDKDMVIGQETSGTKTLGADTVIDQDALCSFTEQETQLIGTHQTTANNPIITTVLTSTEEIVLADEIKIQLSKSMEVESEEPLERDKVIKAEQIGFTTKRGTTEAIECQSSSHYGGDHDDKVSSVDDVDEGSNDTVDYTCSKGLMEGQDVVGTVISCQTAEQQNDLKAGLEWLEILNRHSPADTTDREKTEEKAITSTTDHSNQYIKSGPSESKETEPITNRSEHTGLMKDQVNIDKETTESIQGDDVESVDTQSTEKCYSKTINESLMGSCDDVDAYHSSQEVCDITNNMTESLKQKQETFEQELESLKRKRSKMANEEMTPETNSEIMVITDSEISIDSDKRSVVTVGHNEVETKECIDIGVTEIIRTETMEMETETAEIVMKTSKSVSEEILLGKETDDTNYMDSGNTKEVYNNDSKEKMSSISSLTMVIGNMQTSESQRDEIVESKNSTPVVVKTSDLRIEVKERERNVRDEHEDISEKKIQEIKKTYDDEISVHEDQEIWETVDEVMNEKDELEDMEIIDEEETEDNNLDIFKVGKDNDSKEIVEIANQTIERIRDNKEYDQESMLNIVPAVKLDEEMTKSVYHKTRKNEDHEPMKSVNQEPIVIQDEGSEEKQEQNVVRVDPGTAVAGDQEISTMIDKEPIKKAGGEIVNKESIEKVGGEIISDANQKKLNKHNAQSDNPEVIKDVEQEETLDNDPKESVVQDSSKTVRHNIVSDISLATVENVDKNPVKDVHEEVKKKLIESEHTIQAHTLDFLPVLSTGDSDIDKNAIADRKTPLVLLVKLDDLQYVKPNILPMEVAVESNVSHVPERTQRFSSTVPIGDGHIADNVQGSGDCTVVDLDTVVEDTNITNIEQVLGDCEMNDVESVQGVLEIDDAVNSDVESGDIVEVRGSEAPGSLVDSYEVVCISDDENVIEAERGIEEMEGMEDMEIIDSI